MSINKIAQSIDLSIKIPESEKESAEKASVHLTKLEHKLEAFNKYLNIMYHPFKKYQSVSDSSVSEYRGAIWKYANKIRDDFNDIKKYASYCVKHLVIFRADMQINEILNTFLDTIGEIADSVDLLFTVLTSWNAPNYQKNVIEAMDKAKDSIAEARKIIFDRVIDYINSNILNKSWVDSLDESFQSQFNDEDAYVSKLYHERENRIKGYM